MIRNRLSTVLVAIVSLAICAPDRAGGVEPTVDEPTEKVIEGALKWMASQQESNGSWSLERGTKGHPVAITGYTLLALMSAGNLPDEGPYGKHVALGMQYLMEQIQPDGIFRDVSGGQYMYNHGIATTALCEIYGQTRSAVLKPKIEKLVDVIVRSQSEDGGWRYQPRPQSSDISVTVLQSAALRSATNAGLPVPKETVENAIAYVRACRVAQSGGFAYMANRNEAGFARTAAAIYTLQVMGLYEDPFIAPGIAYMFSKWDEKKWFPYGHYYAAPALYLKGGEEWARWYKQIKAKLLDDVQWEGDMAYWKGGGNQGPPYSTAVYVHILAMPYHYLPLYQR